MSLKNLCFDREFRLWGITWMLLEHHKLSKVGWNSLLKHKFLRDIKGDPNTLDTFIKYSLKNAEFAMDMHITSLPLEKILQSYSPFPMELQLVDVKFAFSFNLMHSYTR